MYNWYLPCWSWKFGAVIRITKVIFTLSVIYDGITVKARAFKGQLGYSMDMSNTLKEWHVWGSPDFTQMMGKGILPLIVLHLWLFYLSSYKTRRYNNYLTSLIAEIYKGIHRLAHSYYKYIYEGKMSMSELLSVEYA